MFIAIEGIDGSGKGTHAKLLNRWLKEKGYDTFLTTEPTTSEIGAVLREGLKHGKFDSKTEALLFAADRSEHLEKIRSNLGKGKIVITERYFYSSIAYQGASGVSIRWISEINRFAPRPDLTLLLDIEPEEGLQRISSKNSLRRSTREKEYFEKREFLSKVRAIYLDLKREYDDITVIGASGPMDDVQTAIRRKVSHALSAMKKKKKKTKQKGLGEYFSA
ncbi:MAG: dTMP kinase [Candidatus Hydrothermarchaeales archaeon]